MELILKAKDIRVEFKGRDVLDIDQFCFFLWWKYSGCCCSRAWGCSDLGITAISSSGMHE